MLPCAACRRAEGLPATPCADPAAWPHHASTGTGPWGSWGAGRRHDPWLGGIFSDLLKALVTAGKIELPLPPGFPRYLLERSV